MRNCASGMEADRHRPPDTAAGRRRRRVPRRRRRVDVQLPADHGPATDRALLHQAEQGTQRRRSACRRAELPPLVPQAADRRRRRPDRPDHRPDDGQHRRERRAREFGISRERAGRRSRMRSHRRATQGPDQAEPLRSARSPPMASPPRFDGAVAPTTASASGQTMEALGRSSGRSSTSAKATSPWATACQVTDGAVALLSEASLLEGQEARPRARSRWSADHVRPWASTPAFMGLGPGACHRPTITRPRNGT